MVTVVDLKSVIFSFKVHICMYCGSIGLRLENLQRLAQKLQRDCKTHDGHLDSLEKRFSEVS